MATAPVLQRLPRRGWQYRQVKKWHLRGEPCAIAFHQCQFTSANSPVPIHQLFASREGVTVNQLPLMSFPLTQLEHKRCGPGRFPHQPTTQLWRCSPLGLCTLLFALACTSSAPKSAPSPTDSASVHASANGDAIASADTATATSGPTIVTDPAQYADPRMGSGGYSYAHGSAFAGASVPNGMMRVGPDTSGPYGVVLFLHYSGYWGGDDVVRAFSHLHLHGTGATDYGALGILPVPAFVPGKARIED